MSHKKKFTEHGTPLWIIDLLAKYTGNGKAIISLLIILCLSFPVYSALTDKLVSYWSFDETTGQISHNNITTNPDNFTGIGTFTGTGKVGSALWFNGASSYSSINTTYIQDYYNMSWALKQQFAMSIWFKSDRTSLGAQYEGIYNTNKGGDNGISLIRNSGESQFYVYPQPSGAVTYTGTITPGTWYNVILNYDRLNGNVSVYVNGVFVGGNVGVDMPTKTHGLQLGTFRFLQYFFNGSIDEFGIWNRTLNASEIAQLAGGDYYTNFSSPTTPAGLNANVTFYNQTPSNLTTTNAITLNLTLLYNMSQMNITNALVNYTINASFGNGNYWITTNGSVERQGWILSDFQYTNSSTTYTLWTDADNLFPASYNIEHELMINTSHSFISLSGNNLAMTTIYNMSTSAINSFYEMMINTTGSCNVYYCNSSYSSGNPLTNTNCILLKTFLNVTSFNHTHGLYSRHNLIPFTINNSKIGNIGVSQTSYIIAKDISGICDIGDVALMTKTDTTKTSSNNGNTWTNQVYTLDGHLHQFLADKDYLQYQACSSNGTIICESVLHTDIFDKTGLAPLPVEWINPPKVRINYNFSNTINAWILLNYTSGFVNGNQTMLYYNISIYDSNYNFVSVKANNSLNLTYNLSLYGLSLGFYKVDVRDYQDNGLYADSFSDTIWLFSNVTSNQNITFVSETPANNSVINVTTATINVTTSFNASTCDINYSANIYGWLSMNENTLTNYWYDISPLYPLDSGLNTYEVRCVNDSMDYVYSGIMNVNVVLPCFTNWNAYYGLCNGTAKQLYYIDMNNCNSTSGLPANNGTFQSCSLPNTSVTQLGFENNTLLLIILFFFFVLCLHRGYKGRDIDSVIYYFFASAILFIIAMSLFQYIQNLYWINLIIMLFLMALFLIYYAVSQIIKYLKGV